MKDNAMTERDVADYLKLSRQMVHTMVRHEELPAIKIGKGLRIMTDDLERYVRNQKTIQQAKRVPIAAEGDEGSVSARHLCSHRGSFKLVDIDFSLPIGSVLGILGPSGAGKTLLLKSMAGLAELDAGAFYIGKKRVDETLPDERRIGYVFQDYALYPRKTSRQNIAFPREIAGAGRQAVEETVARVAGRLKLPQEYLDKDADILPRGIKQLVAIGRAENRDAGLFIMDEPLVHLDPALRREMRVFLAALREESGATAIFGFNDAEDALALSDYLMIVIDGRMTQFGTLDEVYGRPAGLEEMELLSLEGVNRVSVRVKDGRTELRGIEAPVADGDWIYCFRPEEIEFGSGPLSASVERISPRTGSEGLALARLDTGETLSLVLPLDCPKKIRFAPSAPRFFPLSA